jgi:hypothetical protein
MLGLVVPSLYQLFILKILFTFLGYDRTLIRSSTVLSLVLKLVFPVYVLKLQKFSFEGFDT